MVAVRARIEWYLMRMESWRASLRIRGRVGMIFWNVSLGIEGRRLKRRMGFENEGGFENNVEV